MITIFEGKKTGKTVIDGKGTTLVMEKDKPCIKIAMPNICIQNFTFTYGEQNSKEAE